MLYPTQASLASCVGQWGVFLREVMARSGQFHFEVFAESLFLKTGGHLKLTTFREASIRGSPVWGFLPLRYRFALTDHEKPGCKNTSASSAWSQSFSPSYADVSFLLPSSS
jgi:hypothetical protein